MLKAKCNKISLIYSFCYTLFMKNQEVAKIFNEIADLLEIKGDWVAAQKFYRAALDIDPTYKPASANLERTTSWHKTGKVDLGPDKDETGLREGTGEKSANHEP